MAGWATLARERADQLKNELEELQAAGIAVDGLNERLADLRSRRIDAKQRMVDRFTGDAVNESWSELHRIEERIDELTPDVAEVVTRAEQHVQEELPRRRADDLKAALRMGQGPKVRVSAVAAIHEAHRAAESRHESERNQQRGIVAIAAALFVAALILLLLQATALGRNSLVPLPSDGATIRPWALLALVMLFGMLGGAISALVSLYITNRQFTNTLWFDPRPGLVVVKVVLGLWTAIVGVLAVGTGTVVGVYTSVASVLLLAFVFGYAQQAVTTFIDRKVTATLEEKKP